MELPKRDHFITTPVNSMFSKNCKQKVQGHHIFAEQIINSHCLVYDKNRSEHVKIEKRAGWQPDFSYNAFCWVYFTLVLFLNVRARVIYRSIQTIVIKCAHFWWRVGLSGEFIQSLSINLFIATKTKAETKTTIQQQFCGKETILHRTKKPWKTSAAANKTHFVIL